MEEIAYDTKEDLPSYKSGDLMETQGIVKGVYDKTVKGGKVVYSFKLYNDDNFYRTGFDKPAFNENDEVKFSYEKTQYGLEVDAKQVKHREGTAPPVVTQGAKAGGSKAVGGRDDYWAEKDRYDKVVRQPIIMYQAATQVAKDLAIAGLGAGILPTVGTKKDAKFESFLDIVKEIRNEVYTDYLEASQRLEAGEPAVVVSDDTVDAPAIEKAAVPAEPEDPNFQELEEDDWS